MFLISSTHLIIHLPINLMFLRWSNQILTRKNLGPFWYGFAQYIESRLKNDFVTSLYIGLYSLFCWCQNFFANSQHFLTKIVPYSKQYYEICVKDFLDLFSVFVSEKVTINENVSFTNHVLQVLQTFNFTLEHLKNRILILERP